MPTLLGSGIQHLQAILPSLSYLILLDSIRLSLIPRQPTMDSDLDGVCGGDGLVNPGIVVPEHVAKMFLND